MGAGRQLHLGASLRQAGPVGGAGERRLDAGCLSEYFRLGDEKGSSDISARLWQCG
jgi:hypothetical protein